MLLLSQLSASSSSALKQQQQQQLLLWPLAMRRCQRRSYLLLLNTVRFWLILTTLVARCHCCFCCCCLSGCCLVACWYGLPTTLFGCAVVGWLLAALLKVTKSRQHFFAALSLLNKWAATLRMAWYIHMYVCMWVRMYRWSWNQTRALSGWWLAAGGALVVANRLWTKFSSKAKHEVSEVCLARSSQV